MNDSRRRDFLKVAGSVGVVGALAGCAGEAQEEEDEPQEPDEDAPDEEPEEEEQEEQEEEEPEEEGDDLIRVAHMIPDFPAVDVYVDDSEEPVFDGVGYTDTTDYVELPEGEYQIRVTAADARSLVIFNEEVSVPAGSTTAVALGEPEEDEPANGQQEEGGEEIGFELELFEDDNTPPEESINDSRLRLVHASLDAPAVDVRVGQTTVFENIEFGEGEYFDLPAGDYEFEIFPANGEEAGDEPGEDEDEDEENGILSLLAADGGRDISLLQQEEDEEPEDEDEDVPEEEDEEPGAESEDEDEDAPEEEEDEEEEPGAEPEDEEEEEEEEAPEDEEEEEEEEPDEDEPVFTFSATTEENSVSTAFAVGYLDPEAAESDEEFDVVVAEDVVDGEVVQEEDEEDDD